VWKKIVHYLASWTPFTFLSPILPLLKNFSKNLSACIILVLDVLPSPEISFGEKAATHPDTQLIFATMNLGAEEKARQKTTKKTSEHFSCLMDATVGYQLFFVSSAKLLKMSLETF